MIKIKESKKADTGTCDLVRRMEEEKTGGTMKATINKKKVIDLLAGAIQRADETQKLYDFHLASVKNLEYQYREVQGGITVLKRLLEENKGREDVNGKS